MSAQLYNFVPVKVFVPQMTDEELREAAAHPFALDDGTFHTSFYRNVYNAAVDELNRREEQKEYASWLRNSTS